jgi:hypothetical protein
MSACGQATAAPPEAKNTIHISAPVKARSPAHVTRGTSGEQQLLKKIVDGMNPSDIVSVGIAGPPITAPNVPASAVWLKVVHPSVNSTSDADLTQGRWEGLVVASAYLEQCDAAGVPCIQGVEMVGPDGSVDGDFAGLISIHSHNQTSSSSDPALAARLKAAAQATGLSSVTVSFEDAAGFSVPVITGQTNDPATFVHNYRSVSILGPTPPFAAFVKVVDQNGSPLYAEGLSAATQQGTAWIEPGLNANTLGVIIAPN